MRRDLIVALVCAGACRFEPGAFPIVEDADDIDAPRMIDARMIDTPMVDARECPAAPGNCTSFQCEGSSSCYYICGTATMGKQSYTGAVGSCTNANLGCIVTIETAAENTCIAQHTVPSFPNALVWVGYEQASSGAEPAGGWGWECGTSSFLPGNWGMFEPNNEGGNEDCAAMLDAGGAWMDALCSGSARFVCELP